MAHPALRGHAPAERDAPTSAAPTLAQPARVRHPAKTSLKLPRKAKALIGKEGCDGNTHPTEPHGYQATVDGHLPSKKKA